jgi:3-hydroxyacyl-[acyl-carrier-protein] dehydratase
VKISDVRFRSPVYPGDTVTIEVRKKDEMAGFYLMAGAMRRGDTRVLSVNYSVAWRRLEDAP